MVCPQHGTGVLKGLINTWYLLGTRYVHVACTLQHQRTATAVLQVAACTLISQRSSHNVCDVRRSGETRDGTFETETLETSSQLLYYSVHLVYFADC